MAEKIKRFSVVDVETTGFGRDDKICEIAIVGMDAETLEVIDEFETLINPQKNIGRTAHIHKITESMIVGAPTFQNIASEIAERLDRSVLVAHNLPFDNRMIAQEFDEMNATYHPGQGVCTLKLTGEKLARAAEQNGISHNHLHRASEDARVTAKLFRLLCNRGETTKPARVVVRQNALSRAQVVVRDYH